MGCVRRGQAWVLIEVESTAFTGGVTKAELLAEVCTVLGVPRARIGVGSSLPSQVFDEAARQVGVSYGSMPEIGEAVARRAGLAWTAACDSRGSLSGGGSTVTREGLSVLLDALRRLL